ncbi:putative reverse transcriptase domain-containing protein [Tanacetum coccineum]
MRVHGITNVAFLGVRRVIQKFLEAQKFIFQGKRYVENSKYQYSSLGHAISDISDDSSTAASARSSQKRCSSPTSYVLVVFPICGALSPVRADLSPPPKRIRDSDLVTDLEISSDDGYEPVFCVLLAANYELEGWMLEELCGLRLLLRGVETDGARGGHMNGSTRSPAVFVMSERISELEQDNTRLRGMLDVMSQRVSQVQRKELRVQRETMTREAFDSLIARRVVKELEARNAARNLEPLAEGGDEQEDKNGDDYEGGNGGGNRNGNGNGGGNDDGNGNGNECTFQDFLKCQPLNFNGTEGVVGLTCWFEKMETVIIGVDAAYAIRWTKFMKLKTEVYCLRNEIQKMETKLWNLTMKGNDVTAYTRRFQDLVLLCTIMVLDEEDKVERFIGGLPDNIQGNVIATEPTILQDEIRIANNLMDQKVKGYARNGKNKRRFDNNPRDNHGQQPSFKRENVRGQNVARSYTAENNEKKGYVGSLPYCNKCKLHHEGPCIVKCGNCKRVGHMTRDCTAAVAPNTQRALVGNQSGVICYECGRPGHYRKNYSKLRNQNCGNKNRNKTGNNEATAKAYAIGEEDLTLIPTALLDVAPSTLDTSYVVELADGRIQKLIFDVIIGMDWLEKYHAVIICDEKIIRIPYGDEMLII